MKDRKLEDVQLCHELWAEATDELLRDDLDTREQADFYGAALADDVMRGGMTIAVLRATHYRANQLEKEAIEASGYDIENLGDADYLEAIARRIANQATAAALRQVRTPSRKFVTLIGRKSHAFVTTIYENQ